MIFGKKTKIWKIVISIILSVLIGMTTSCGDKNHADSNTSNPADEYITIVFPEKFHNLIGMNEEELLEYLKTNGDDNYEKLSISDGTVEMALTDDQVDYWKDYCKGLADEQITFLTDISKKYKGFYNDSLNEINVYYDMALSTKDASEIIGHASMYCAFYQIFDGKQDYSVTLNIYNVDTEKLVVGGDLETEDVSYDDTVWSKSYTLNEAEASQLDSKSENKGTLIHINSTFIDAIEVINILQSAGGNDYQYVYIDNQGSCWLNITDAQRQVLTENLDNYLDSLSSDFKQLGNNYEITWNSDYSSVSYQFDAALSKQDQTNYFIYAETICMLQQLLKGDGDSYYIDLSIYDSSTGELVSTGNTKDGITWNIGV